MTLTTLNKFNSAEVRKLQLALELDASFLDEGSYLFERLVRLETRDQERGMDRSNCVKDLANKANEIIARIDSAYLSPNFGATTIAKSVKDEVSKRVTYDNVSSIATGLIKQKESLQSRIRRELEWIDDYEICLG